MAEETDQAEKDKLEAMSYIAEARMDKEKVGD